MTARVNYDRRNFGASYHFRVREALGNLRNLRRFRMLVEQRVQVNVPSLRSFLRSSTGPNRVFEPQSLGSYGVRKLRGQALFSVFEGSRIRWIISISCLSLLDSAKARSTRRTRLLTLSGWLKPKAGVSSRRVAEDRRRASQAATSLPNCPLRRA